MNKIINKNNIMLSLLPISIILIMIFIFISTFNSIKITNAYIQNFSIIFISIILEAIPFVLIGAFVASFIQLFVSEQFISKIIPKNRFIALLIASLMGLIFPVCECAIVPIMRKLIKKGVPTYIAITFMLSVPIVNPVVIMSTSYAFVGQSYMVILRTFMGLIGAIVIGVIFSFLKKDNNIFINNETSAHCCCHHHHDDSTTNHHDCNEHKHDNNEPSTSKKIYSSIINILDHTSHEFYDVGRFLIIGSFLSALMQILIKRDVLLSIGQGKVFSIIVMMILAFVLSLCSEADAFIAKTFVSQFSVGSITAFLIFGPMIDIKNTLMLSGTFKGKFVIKLISIITLVCFSISLLVNLLF